MKKTSAALVCGLSAIVLTVILFFTILGNIVLTTIHFITLLAILLAEGITTLYACSAKGSPRRVAAAVISTIMIPYSVILSVVYIVNFPSGYGTYLGWYFAGTVIVNLIAVILCRFDSSKSAEDDQLQNAKQNMLGLRKLVMSILADPAAEPYSAQLRAIEEKLHFSNDAVIVAEDENIRQMLVQLKGNIADPAFDAEEKMKAIDKAITSRNIMNTRNV